jgi:hypothetical protein
VQGKGVNFWTSLPGSTRKLIYRADFNLEVEKSEALSFFQQQGFSIKQPLYTTNMHLNA